MYYTRHCTVLCIINGHKSCHLIMANRIGETALFVYYFVTSHVMHRLTVIFPTFKVNLLLNYIIKATRRFILCA